VRGSLSWAPDYGSELSHKAPRPADLTAEAQRLERLIAGVPRVDSVAVTMTWDAGHLIVEIDVRSSLGELREQVQV
jgi:hypothetical protein